MQADLVIDKLKAIEIFSDFAEETEKNLEILKAVAKVLEEVSFSANDFVFKKGDSAKGMYILLDGTVQVTRTTIQGEPFAVYNLSSEENVFFGQKALITKGERSATVKAVSNCKAAFLSTEAFFEICDKEPLLGYKALYRIASNLAKYLKESNKDLLTLYQALIDEIDES